MAPKSSPPGPVHAFKWWKWILVYGGLFFYLSRKVHLYRGVSSSNGPSMSLRYVAYPQVDFSAGRLDLINVAGASHVHVSDRTSV